MFNPEKSIFDTIIAPLWTFITGKYIIGKSSLARENPETAKDIAKLRSKNMELQGKLLTWEARYSNIPGLLKARLPLQHIKKFDYKETKNRTHNRNRVWGGVLSTSIVTLIALRMAVKGQKISLNSARIIGASIGTFLISSLSAYNTLESESSHYEKWMIQLTQEFQYLTARKNMYKTACENSWFPTFFYTISEQNAKVDDEEMAINTNENHKVIEV
jgi:hypothetical protein